ncbi:MAG: TetR/AcrR family transcriptional regulator [Pseudonocardiaceae bacterium]
MNARERILDGAAEVMRSRGLANTTTKEIAKAAGLSEAMLYKVFQDKVDLFLGVLTERLPRVSVFSDGLAAGRGTVLASLRRLATEILSFYLESFPIAASVFSDPQLLSRHRLALGERGAGPERLVEAVAAYLSAEQRAGRVAATARPEVVAELLVGACLHHAFLACFAQETISPARIRRFASNIVMVLEPALRPV